MTQMTLNSVDWNEIILLKNTKTKQTKTLPIGEFIDELIEQNLENVQHLGDNLKEEMGKVEYLDISEMQIYIPSVDENGKVSWKLIEAVTKHLPINTDGTHTLVKVKTESGKEVTATKAKSFLTQVDNKIVPIRGDEIKIGTLLPISQKFPEFGEILHESELQFDKIASIEEVEPSHEYVYDFTVVNTKTFALANGLQMMDSFHHAGIASMSATVQGVPRMKELLSVSKNPKTPQMVIYLTEEYMSNKDMAHKIASNIKYTTLGDTRGRINVYYDPHPNAKGGHMEKDNVKNLTFQYKGSRSSCQADVNGLPWLMRIELDREKMLEKEVTLLEIKSKFCSWWEKRFNDTKVVKGEEKKVLNKINQLTILSNSDNDEQPVLHIRFNVKDGEKDKFNMGTIDNFIDLIIDKFKLKGLNSIIDIPAIQEERLLRINEDTGNEDKLTQHVIYATGVNLLDIRYFNGVDLNKTLTNNVMDVYETFGIEIARAVLMKEIIGAYSNAGGEVNYQHVTMIVDQMTAMGTINSIDRHGMNKSDSDPLARASFEKTVEQLLIASVYGETDYMRSVSSRIMAGAVVKAGTGFCEIEFDTDLVEKSEYVEGIDYTKKFTELHENTLAKDVIGKKDEDIFIPM